MKIVKLLDMSGEDIWLNVDKIMLMFYSNEGDSSIQLEDGSIHKVQDNLEGIEEKINEPRS